MSLLPYILDELLYDRYQPGHRLTDQNFGYGLLPDELILSRPSLTGFSTPLHAGYIRPLRHSRQEQSGVSTISNDKDGFKINLDVQQFKPEEVNVKVVDDYVVVEGKHEERQDKHGYISRQFTRRYKLPPQVNVDAIKSNLSSDGILSVTAPKKAIDKSGARDIEIVQTNQPAIKQGNKSTGSGEPTGEKMET